MFSLLCKCLKVWHSIHIENGVQACSTCFKSTVVAWDDSRYLPPKKPRWFIQEYFSEHVIHIHFFRIYERSLQIFSRKGLFSFSLLLNAYAYLMVFLHSIEPRMSTHHYLWLSNRGSLRPGMFAAFSKPKSN